jgi:hypothetical protein
MIEHRKHERIRDRLVVVCSLPGNSRLEEITVCEDISQGGIRLITPKHFSTKEIMNIEINVYCDAVPLSLRGEVVWTKEMARTGLGKNEKRYALGLSFIHVNYFSGERIFRYINRAKEKSKK